LTPAVVALMREALPCEPYDPEFYGQELETTYFDTLDFDLRKARRRGDQYLTLRLRRYRPSEAYAVSAKTESDKFRTAIDPEQAEVALGAKRRTALLRLSRRAGGSSSRPLRFGRLRRDAAAGAESVGQPAWLRPGHHVHARNALARTQRRRPDRLGRRPP